jgi:hypothetical protein
MRYSMAEEAIVLAGQYGLVLLKQDGVTPAARGDSIAYARVL